MKLILISPPAKPVEKTIDQEHIWTFEDEHIQSFSANHNNTTDQVMATSSEQIDSISDFSRSDQAGEYSPTRSYGSFDEELGDVNDKSLNPAALPEAGQLILFWDPDSNSKKLAKVIKMFKTVQLKNPGWRNVIVQGETSPRGLNLDLVSDNCIRWMFYERDTDLMNDEEGGISGSETGSSSSQHSHLDLRVPDTGILEENRVYRLPGNNIPTYENLRITVDFPHVNQAPRFNRQDPLRTRYNRSGQSSRQGDNGTN